MMDFIGWDDEIPDGKSFYSHVPNHQPNNDVCSMEKAIGFITSHRIEGINMNQSIPPMDHGT